MVQKIRVLLVDDNPMLRESLRTLLERDGFDVTDCEDGDIAVARARESCFDALVIDFRMPIMNGNEAVQLIRPLCPDMLIIGFSVEIKEAAFLAAGADCFVGKHELVERLTPTIRARYP